MYHLVRQTNKSHLLLVSFLPTLSLDLCSCRTHIEGHQLIEWEATFLNYIQLQHLILVSFWSKPDVNYLHVEKWNSFPMTAHWIWPKPENWSPNMRLQSQARDCSSAWISPAGCTLEKSMSMARACWHLRVLLEMLPIYFLPSEAKCDL